MKCIDLALHSVAGPSHKRTATSGSDKAVPSEEGIEDEIYQGVLRRAYRHFKVWIAALPIHHRVDFFSAIKRNL